MHADPSPDTVWLYQAASLCQLFPAYRLHELLDGDVPIVPLLQAAELLSTARKVQSS